MCPKPLNPMRCAESLFVPISRLSLPCLPSSVACDGTAHVSVLLEGQARQGPSPCGVLPHDRRARLHNGHGSRMTAMAHDLSLARARCRSVDTERLRPAPHHVVSSEEPLLAGRQG